MQQIGISNNNTSSMWKTIKNVLNKGYKKQVHLQDLQNEDGTLTKSSLKKVQTKSIHIFL